MTNRIFKRRGEGSGGEGLSAEAHERGWLYVNVHTLFGVIGTSLCVGWHLSLLLRPDLLYATDCTFEPLHGLMGFIIAAFLVYFVMSMVASLVQSHRFACGLLALLSALIAFIPLGGGYLSL